MASLDTKPFESGVYTRGEHGLFLRTGLADIIFDEEHHPDHEESDDHHYPATHILGGLATHDLVVITDRQRPFVVSHVDPTTGEGVLVSMYGIISYTDVWMSPFLERQVNQLTTDDYDMLWEMAVTD